MINGMTSRISSIERIESTRVITRKVCNIAKGLILMGYSIHTLELALYSDSSEFNELLDNAYDNNHSIKKSDNMYSDYTLSKHGIYITYHKDTYRKKIKLIVNPSKVLGCDGLKLWKPKKDNVLKLIRKLNKYINDYFDSKYRLEDFKLRRVDFTVNMDIISRKAVLSYIVFLHNIGRAKGFSYKYEYGTKIKKDRSFDLIGNTNDIEFSIYDKEAELKDREKKSKRIHVEYNPEDAAGILRAEVRLVKPKALRRYTDETDTAKQIMDLSFKCKEIFLDTFVEIIPPGDYYKMKKAKELVEEGIHNKKLREKMLKLLKLVPNKKSLYLALKELNYRNIRHLMETFAYINVSPVTISKRHNVKPPLKSLYSYLD